MNHLYPCWRHHQFDGSFVGEEDIEYTPKPEFEGCFKVTNAQNEVMVYLNPYTMGILYMLSYFLVETWFY